MSRVSWSDCNSFGLLSYSMAKFMIVTKFSVFKDVKNIMCM